MKEDRLTFKIIYSFAIEDSSSCFRTILASKVGDDGLEFRRGLAEEVREVSCHQDECLDVSRWWVVKMTLTLFLSMMGIKEDDMISLYNISIS